MRCFNGLARKYDNTFISEGVLESLKNDLEFELICDDMRSYVNNELIEYCVYWFFNENHSKHFEVMVKHDIVDVEEKIVEVIEEYKLDRIASKEDITNAITYLNSLEIVNEARLNNNLIRVTFNQNEDFSSDLYGHTYSFKNFEVDTYEKGTFYKIDKYLFKEIGFDRFNYNTNYVDLELISC